MYICLCNNLNSKKVNYAIEKGVSSSKKYILFTIVNLMWKVY